MSLSPARICLFQKRQLTYRDFVQFISFINFLCLLILPTAVEAAELENTPVYGPGVFDVLEAVVKERSQLHGWLFEATSVEKDSSISRPAISRMFAAFHGDSDQFRFETEGKLPIGMASIGVNGNKAADLSKVQLHKSNSLIVRNRNCFVEWYGIGEGPGAADNATCHIEIRDREARPLYLGSLAFDPRSAGVIDFTSNERMQSLAAQLNRFAKNAVSVSLENPKADKLAIVYEYKQPFRRRLIINPEGGHTIETCETISLDESRNEAPLGRTTITANWEKHDDIWVPVVISAHRAANDGRLRWAKAKIEWKEINPESLDDELFDYKSYPHFWKSAQILDRRKR